MDEMAAILAYQRGDAGAFGVLFELHAAHVYRTAYLITRNAERAEDVAQETFLILAQRLPGLTPGPLRSWLGRVAANLSLNERRRAWELPLEALSPAHRERLEARDAVAGAESAAQAAEDRALLRAAVEALAPRQRAMVVLRYYGDCSLEEIGAALGGKPSTVRATLHQALKRLRTLAPRHDAGRHATCTRRDDGRDATPGRGEVSHEQG